MKALGVIYTRNREFICCGNGTITQSLKAINILSPNYQTMFETTHFLQKTFEVWPLIISMFIGWKCDKGKSNQEGNPTKFFMIFR